MTVSYLDPLLRPDPVTLAPRPWLAERWQVSEDGREIVYRLRRDVRWHDGRPLTAADVRFSFSVYRDDVDSGVRNFFALMEDAEVLDETTVRVRLRESDAGWLPNASTQPIFQRGQYSAHWLARPEGERTLGDFDWQTSPPIGTGPWRVTGSNDEGFGFERNEDYWAGPPLFERMTLRSVERASDRFARWRQGESDLLWPVRAVALEELGERAGRLYVADAASVMFAAFNFDNPQRTVPDLFDDVRVRRALSLAIDRERIGREVFGGFVRTGAAGTVAQPWANDATVTNPGYDAARARRLLAEAGWADRDGTGLLVDAAGRSFAITAILRNDDRPELFETLQGAKRDLRQVGIDLRVLAIEPERFEERWLGSRDFDLIAYAYDLYPGFADFDLYGSGWDVRVNPQGWNPGGYGNEEADRAISAYLRATDFDDQRVALGALQRATNDDLFGLWFGFGQDLIVVSDEIEGFEPNLLWQTADTRSMWRRED